MRPLASTTVRTLQECLFKDFGSPVRIVSDNEPQFPSKIFRDMCFRHGIEHITVTEYRPQGNLSKRYLRNLKAALIAYHAKNQTTWDQNLAWIQFAFKTAHHEGHRFTPFWLLLICEPNHPVKNKWHIRDLLPEKMSTGQIRETWRKARENLRSNHRSTMIEPTTT